MIDELAKARLADFTLPDVLVLLGAERMLRIVEVEILYVLDADGRIDLVDETVQRVRESFDDVVDETEELSDQAKRSVEDAIDDLERRIESLEEGE